MKLRHSQEQQADPNFAYRVVFVPKLGNRASNSDLAVEFVKSNTDEARELSPEYSASNEGRTELAVAVHEAASYLTREVYRRTLEEPVPEGKLPLVVFTAGGTGAGAAPELKRATHG